MRKLTREQIDRMIDAFTSKDLEKIMSFFHEDAVFNDPHYPIQEMRGKAAIRKGLEWGMNNLIKPGFKVLKYWGNEDNAAIEVDTHHVFKGGLELCILQVFIIESHEGKIDRLQSFVPYPQPGIGGFITKLTRFIWKFKK